MPKPPKPPEAEPLLTVEDAARLTQTSTKWIYAQIRLGRLRVIRFGPQPSPHFFSPYFNGLEHRVVIGCVKFYLRHQANLAVLGGRRYLAHVIPTC
jgi:hypothetical protein